MSRFEVAASIGSLWHNEQPTVILLLRQVISEQLVLSEPVHDLLSHSLHVRNLANAVSIRINERFPHMVDSDLVASSAVIHDWGKLKHQPTINKPYSHYVRTQLDTALAGFPAIGSIAGRHNFGALLRDDPLLLEQMIIIYADIRARSETVEGVVCRRYKTLENSLPEIAEKLRESGKYTKDDILKGNKRLVEFEAILRKNNINIDDLSEIPDGLTPNTRQYYNPSPASSSVPIYKTSKEESDQFLADLHQLDILTLSDEVCAKSNFIRSTIKGIISGDEKASTRLALIDPSRIPQWINLLRIKNQNRILKETTEHPDQNFSLISNPKVLHAARVNHIRVLREVFFLSEEPDFRKRILSAISSLFMGNEIQEDDVAFHAAKAYGEMVGDMKDEDRSSYLEQLWEEYNLDKECSYAPTALEQLAKRREDHAKELYRRMSTDLLHTMGSRAVSLFSQTLLKIGDVDLVKEVASRSRGDDVLTNARESIRYAQLLIPLLHASDIRIRVEAISGLVNLHQRTSNLSLKLYIEGLINLNRVHSVEHHREVLAALKVCEDPLEKIALCQVIGKISYGEHSELLQSAADTLLKILDEDMDNDVKLQALIALGRDGLTRYLSVEQASKVLDSLWRIFYFNQQARKVMPYFIAGIYASRKDLPHMGKDLSNLMEIVSNENHPDRQFQYEAARVFIGLVGAIDDDNDERIRFAQQGILQTQNISPQLFELVFQKYVTRVSRTSRLTTEQKAKRIAGSMVRKYMSSVQGDMTSRYITYDNLHSSMVLPAGKSTDVVVFSGTFDPVHNGSEVAAEVVSQLVGDVFMQADDGNPSKNPKAREIRNQIITKAIADQPGVYLWNEPHPFVYRKPEEYAELRRVFKDRTVWLQVGEDRLRQSSFYEDFKNYVYLVPHVVTIREANFPSCQLEFRDGIIVGEVDDNLLTYLQTKPDFMAKIARFHRIKVIGVPTNFSSTEIKNQIQRGVLRNVDPSTRRVIAQVYADESIADHIEQRRVITDAGEFDRRRQDDELWLMPEEQVDNLLTQLPSIADIPPRDKLFVYYDPITGYGYLCYLKSLSHKTERIIQVFNINSTSLEG